MSNTLKTTNRFRRLYTKEIGRYHENRLVKDPTKPPAEFGSYSLKGLEKMGRVPVGTDMRNLVRIAGRPEVKNHSFVMFYYVE